MQHISTYQNELNVIKSIKRMPVNDIDLPAIGNSLIHILRISIQIIESTVMAFP